MTNNNIDFVANSIVEKIKELNANLTTLNIMVLGKTGVGKSTLINSIFNGNFATTGIGRPVTDHIRKITKPDSHLAIYDTPGLELDGENSVDDLLKEVTRQIEKGNDQYSSTKDKTDKYGSAIEPIHCIWYCVNAASHRFEEAEKDFLDKVCKKAEAFNIPVILVLTQSFAKKDAAVLKHEIEKENLHVANIIPVLASNYEIDEDYTVKAYGLEEITETMEGLLEESVEKTFVSVQKVNLKLKIKNAQKVVAGSVTAAGGTGFIPIPFSDAAVLIPEQIAMLAGITSVFGLPVDKAIITSVISACIGTSGATVLGKSVFSSIMKLIPGVGTVVGGMISGTIAGGITFALGEAYIKVLSLIYKGEMDIRDLESSAGLNMIRDFFMQAVKVFGEKHGRNIPIEYSEVEYSEIEEDEEM